jgi:hypothetical protein
MDNPVSVGKDEQQKGMRTCRADIRLRQTTTVQGSSAFKCLFFYCSQLFCGTTTHTMLPVNLTSLSPAGIE